MCEGSTRDTDVEVRAQEANDLKKSMQEAMLDYKKLLRHEVKKVGFLAARDGGSLLSRAPHTGSFLMFLVFLVGGGRSVFCVLHSCVVAVAVSVAMAAPVWRVIMGAL